MPGSNYPQDRPLCRGAKANGDPCRKRAAAGSAYCGVHGGAKRPIGRPTKLTAELVRRIASAVEHGVTWEVAAAAAGVHELTLLEWRKRGEDEDATGRRTVYADLHRELMRARARGEEVLVDVIRRQAPGDWRAAAWLLERSRPTRWATTAKLEVDVAASTPRIVSPEEPDRRATILGLLGTAMAPPPGAGDP